MKALKIIGFTLIGLLLIVIVVGYMQPSKVELSVSKVVDAPVCAAFDHVNDLEKRTQWSPWEQVDSAMSIQYGQVKKGLGANYSWESPEQGHGELRYIEVEKNKRIKSEIDFGQSTKSYGTMTFQEVPDGTKVTWKFETNLGSNPFQRIFGVIVKTAIKTSFEGGLKNLAENASADQNNPNCIEAIPSEAQQPAQDSATVNTPQPDSTSAS